MHAHCQYKHDRINGCVDRHNNYCCSCRISLYKNLKALHIMWVDARYGRLKKISAPIDDVIMLSWMTCDFSAMVDLLFPVEANM